MVVYFCTILDPREDREHVTYARITLEVNL